MDENQVAEGRYPPGQTYSRWFTVYPSTHERAGQSVEVEAVEALPVSPSSRPAGAWTGKVPDAAIEAHARTLAACAHRRQEKEIGRPIDHDPEQSWRVFVLAAESDIRRVLPHLVEVVEAEGERGREKVTVHCLWARIKDDRYPVQFVAAFSEGLVDAWDECYREQRAEAERFFRLFGDEDDVAEFFITAEQIERAAGPPGGEGGFGFDPDASFERRQEISLRHPPAAEDTRPEGASGE